MSRRTSRTALVCGGVLIITNVAASAFTGRGQAPVAHDGQWWRALDAEQRTEFVAGYASYSTWKRRGPVAFAGSAGVIALRLDARLKSTPQDLTMSIADLLDDDARTAPAGAGWRGSFGGQYWEERGQPGRLGFVQGVLECQRRDARATAKFTKTDAWYVEQLSKWYGVDDPREPDEALMGTSIIDVLMKHEDK